MIRGMRGGMQWPLTRRTERVEDWYLLWLEGGLRTQCP